MGFKERLDEAPKRQTGRACSVGELLDRLPTEDASAVNAMMHELGWSARKIYDAVIAEGETVGYQTINRHRSLSCKCFL